MAKIIITGITGQDGSYMSEYLLANGHRVFGVARRTSTPNFSNLQSIKGNPKFSIHYADLSDSSSIDELIKNIQPDYFINLGAQSFVGASWNIPLQTFDVDALGVVRILEAIRKYCPACRFYNAGSSEQFGDVSYSPQDEAHPFRPRSPYGAAKCAAHHIVKVYRDSYGLYAIQGLLFNHESERRGEEFVTRKITKGVAHIKNALEIGEDFRRIELGNLDSRRDWSHAKDFVRGIWMMLNQEEYNPNLKDFQYKGGSILLASEIEKKKNQQLSRHLKEYVLSSDETHSIREFVEKAFRYVDIEGYWVGEGKDSQFCMKNPSPNASDLVLVNVNPKFYRPAEVELLLGNSSLARKELGWKPEISFDKLVSLMVESDLREASKAE